MESPTVFIDSECLLCNQIVKFILKYEAKPELTFAAFTSSIAQSLNFTIESNTLIFVENQKVYTQSQAVFRILFYLKPPFKFLGFGLVLPQFFCDFVYQIIAKNRYKIWGKTTDYCEIIDSNRLKT